MRPANNRVSASSLQTWEECPQKYAVSYVDYIPGPGGNTPADEGTALHHATQMHVQECLIDKTHDWNDVKRLLSHYEDGYKLAFGTHNVDQEIFKEGIKILKEWHKRVSNSNLMTSEVLAVEEKKFHDIIAINPATGVMEDTGIDLTYIFDRVQKEQSPYGGVSIRVVDYKSVRLRWTHEDLRRKIQMHIYALAAMIEYKELDPEEVWVEIDLLRHNESLAIMFTRDDIARAWKYLKDTVWEIINTERKDAEYRIGPGCRYCPIKLTCPVLNENINLGGIMGLVKDDPTQIAIKREEMKNRTDAMIQLMADFDKQILEFARNEDILEWQDEHGNTITIKSKGARKVLDTELVAKIIGPDKMSRNGKIGVGDIDRMIKNGELDEDQTKRVKALIEKQFGAPTVNVKLAGGIEK